MTKPTFEDALALIEAQGIELFEYQKVLLRAMLGNENYYFLPARGMQRDDTLNTVVLLNQLLTKENNDDNTRF